MAAACSVLNGYRITDIQTAGNGAAIEIKRAAIQHQLLDLCVLEHGEGSRIIASIERTIKGLRSYVSGGAVGVVHLCHSNVLFTEGALAGGGIHFGMLLTQREGCAVGIDIVAAVAANELILIALYGAGGGLIFRNDEMEIGR